MPRRSLRMATLGAGGMEPGLGRLETAGGGVVVAGAERLGIAALDGLGIAAAETLGWGGMEALGRPDAGSEAFVPGVLSGKMPEATGRSVPTLVAGNAVSTDGETAGVETGGRLGFSGDGSDVAAGIIGAAAGGTCGRTLVGPGSAAIPDGEIEPGCSGVGAPRSKSGTGAVETRERRRQSTNALIIVKRGRKSEVKADGGSRRKIVDAQRMEKLVGMVVMLYS